MCFMMRTNFGLTLRWYGYFKVKSIMDFLKSKTCTPVVESYVYKFKQHIILRDADGAR